MCWREKQILISFRKPSLRQLILGGPWKVLEGGDLSLPGPPQFCALPLPLSRLARGSLSCGSRRREEKSTKKESPVPKGPFSSHFSAEAFLFMGSQTYNTEWTP